MTESPYVMFQLERRSDSDKWSAVRMWKSKNDDGPGDHFVIGEPVHLRSFVILSLPGLPKGENAVWWIQGFKIEATESDGPRVAVSDARDGPAVTHVEVTQLEKLNEMMRLAVEYAY